MNDERKVWLVTGASRGLGVDIVKAALAAGHTVVGTGHIEPEAQQVVVRANRDRKSVV